MPELGTNMEEVANSQAKSAEAETTVSASEKIAFIAAQMQVLEARKQIILAEQRQEAEDRYL